MSNVLPTLSELEKVTLYHGTSCGDIQVFQLDKGRTGVDFGRGIYFTTKLQQAIDWSLKYSDRGFVYVCELDISNLELLEYTENCDDFSEVIHLCRLDLEDLAEELVDRYESADCIYGLLVDGKRKHLEKLAEDYNDGTILFPEYYRELERILFNSNKDQLCIKSDLALKKLKILEVIKTVKTASRETCVESQA